MARPRKYDPLAPPCPRGHTGRVVLSHLYGAPGLQRRMYRCVPEGEQSDGLDDRPHRFAPALPRLRSTGECQACEHHFGEHDGHQSAQEYWFTAREAAAALVDLARGHSYRRSSFDARAAAGRIPAKARRNGTLVADWLEVFGDVLWQAAQPTVKPPFPSAIYVDVLVYRRRQTHLNGRRAMSGPKRLFVYVAMAYLTPGEPTPVLLWADTRDDRAAWARFYRQVGAQFQPGAPTWVVCDGEHAARAAIPVVWPTASLWRCHWHIARIAREHLKRLKVPPTDPRYVNADKVMRSSTTWNQFVADATALGDAKLTKWVNANQGLITRQVADVAAGTRPPALAIGQCEGWQEQVKTAFRRRAGSFTNLPRLRQLLLLMTLDACGQAQPENWAATIRTELKRTAGTPTYRPRRLTEPAGSPSIT